MASLLRLGPLLLALAGCALLVVAEFTTLTAIRVITVDQASLTGGENHSYALLVIAVAAAVMAWGATLGGSGPAAWALLALALAAAAVVVLVDLPDVNEEGLVGERYEQAQASPQAGFYLESLGAALLLVAAVARLLLGSAAGRRPPRGDAGPPEPDRAQTGVT